MQRDRQLLKNTTKPKSPRFQLNKVVTEIAKLKGNERKKAAQAQIAKLLSSKIYRPQLTASRKALLALLELSAPITVRLEGRNLNILNTPRNNTLLIVNIAGRKFELSDEQISLRFEDLDDQRLRGIERFLSKKQRRVRIVTHFNIRRTIKSKRGAGRKATALIGNALLTRKGPKGIELKDFRK